MSGLVLPQRLEMQKSLHLRRGPKTHGGGSYVGPLDIVANAAVAYGQRAMSSAKRGSVIYTIREDSGNTTQSFNSNATTGTAPSAAILSFLNGASGFVTNWADQSANSNNLAQATNSTQPKWADAQQGGRPGLIGIDAEKTMTSLGATSLPNGVYTIFVVGLRALHFVSLGGGDFFEIQTGQSPLLDLAVGADEATRSFDGSGVSDVDYVIWDGVCGIGVTGLKANEVSLTENGGSDTGSSIGPLSRTWKFDGLVDSKGLLEVIIYPTTLSGGDRLAIAQNMADYYGITLP